MDTRIGYPNEHLGQGFDEVKSPMYATGVGLVIKGMQEMDKAPGKVAKGSDALIEETPKHRGGWLNYIFG